MSNQYRALHPSLVAQFGDGLFEHEFGTVEERDWCDRGLLEIVPRPYRVVGPHVVHGCEPGDTFDAALTMEQEAALIEGGHLERVDPQPTPKRAARAQTPKE